MVQEAYVSFETAKLLKEKGFDEDINLWYDKNGDKFFKYHYEISRDWRVRQNQQVYQCPTQQMAMRWLREAHNLVICAEIANENNKGNTDYSNPDRWSWFFDLTNEKGVVIEPESDYILNEFDSYEDAVEVAIQYCLTYLI